MLLPHTDTCTLGYAVNVAQYACNIMTRQSLLLERAYGVRNFLVLTIHLLCKQDYTYQSLSVVCVQIRVEHNRQSKCLCPLTTAAQGV